METANTSGPPIHQAKNAPRDMAAMVARLGHDLRSPLNAILGYAQLLLEEGGDNASDLSRILEAGHQHLAHINALMAFMQYEAGRSDLGGTSDSSDDIRDRFDHAAMECASQIAAHGVELDWEVPSAPVAGAFPEDLMTRVIHSWTAFMAHHARAQLVRLRLSETPSDVSLAILGRGSRVDADTLSWALSAYDLGPVHPGSDWILEQMGLKTALAGVRALGGRSTMNPDPDGLEIMVSCPKTPTPTRRF